MTGLRHRRPRAAAEIPPGQAHGLLITFLITLVPLAGAGVLLLATRRHYVVDVASAGDGAPRRDTPGHIL